MAGSGYKVRTDRICQALDVSCEGKRGAKHDSIFFQLETPHTKTKALNCYGYTNLFMCDNYEATGKVTCNQNSSSKTILTA